MKRVTVEEIFAWGPCRSYTLEYLNRLFKGRKYSTPKHIAEAPIDPNDKTWVLAHMMSETNARLCACEIMSRVARRKDYLPERDRKRMLRLIQVGRDYARHNCNIGELLVAARIAWQRHGKRGTSKKARHVYRMINGVLDTSIAWRWPWYAADHAGYTKAQHEDPRLTGEHIRVHTEECEKTMKIALRWAEKG